MCPPPRISSGTGRNAASSSIVPANRQQNSQPASHVRSSRWKCRLSKSRCNQRLSLFQAACWNRRNCSSVYSQSGCALILISALGTPPYLSLRVIAPLPLPWVRSLGLHAPALHSLLMHAFPEQNVSSSGAGGSRFGHASDLNVPRCLKHASAAASVVSGATGQSVRCGGQLQRLRPASSVRRGSLCARGC